LREIDFGQWEGLTWKRIKQQDEVYARRWVAEYPHLPAPDGENVLDFEQRVLGEIKFMLTEATSKGRSIAVITHAGVLRAILCKLLNCSEEEAWNRTSSYCSVVRYPVAFDETGRMQGEKL
jgi:broad specificity phosphatase PhoE